MPSIKLIISDLHLGDGDPILDGFGNAQQAALEGLLKAACKGFDREADSSGTGATNWPLRKGGGVEDVELIINGDCFDFLTIPAFQTNGTTDPVTALEKLDKVLAAHTPFFEALYTFISTPEHSVTFLVGNHDVELCFAEVRTRIAETIYNGLDEGNRVNFCTSRFYRPLPDVYIEHGNQYDFWNSIHGIWDEKGNALTLSPSSIRLPLGSQYVLRVGHPISLAYPYFDHFEPSINIVRQIAFLSLLNPDLLIESAERLMGLFTYPRKALAGLAPGDKRVPARLFEHAMLDFLAFQQDAEAHAPEWNAARVDLQESSTSAEAQANAMVEFLALRDTLTLPLQEAIAAICTPRVYTMGEDVAKGMQHILKSDPTLRYTIAGHSHMCRVSSIRQGGQSYLNTGTWTRRVELPRPGKITAELVEWLRTPDWKNIPLQDTTQFPFVLISKDEGRPSEARLYIWEGGVGGSYRLLE